MSTPAQTMKSAVVSKVQSVTKISLVYETDSPTNVGYPFATVVLAEQGGQYADSASNLLTFKFRIRCFYDRGTDTPSGIKTAEEALMRIMDDLTDAFHSDYTLAGTANGGVDVVASSLGYAELQSGPARVIDMALTCKSLVSIV